MAVLIVVIVLDVIIVGMLLYWGLRHDAHNAIRSPESSKAVQVLAAQTAGAADYLKSVEEQQPETETATEEEAKPAAKASGKSTKAESSPLGDEEERQRRREEALRRKAARQSPTSDS